MPFTDRAHAGRRLALWLSHLQGTDAVVLALPRGGVPVGYEVARALGVPLDVLVVRKLGVPFQPELAMGAIGEAGARVVNPEVLQLTGVDGTELATVELAERAELRRRLVRFRGGRPRVRVAGRIAIVVDDGIATGATIRAACQVARAQHATRVVLAAPVAPAGVASALSDLADEVVCVETPEWLGSIGQWYDDFAQTSDRQVVALLDRAATGAPATRPDVDWGAEGRRSAALGASYRPDPAADVVVPAGRDELAGRLAVPESPTGLVIVAHGSASCRHSPRGRYLAEELYHAGFGVLSVDLLTPDEETDRHTVFNVPLLGARLVQAIDWLRGQPEGKLAPIGLSGAGTGATAALWAASDIDTEVAAVVSRGGRADLTGERLALVRAPTLLLVGGMDHSGFDLNRAARLRLRCPSRLAVVPGAGPLFEEPGTLEVAAQLAQEWLHHHLAAVAAI
jgi:putative phosphoribosyl transferase